MLTINLLKMREILTLELSWGTSNIINLLIYKNVDSPYMKIVAFIVLEKLILKITK